jgi:hypothetical protein
MPLHIFDDELLDTSLEWRLLTPFFSILYSMTSFHHGLLAAYNKKIFLFYGIVAHKTH